MTKEVLPDRQFDFWLGDWEVTWGDGRQGTNRVEKILDGRVIRESFDGSPAMPFQGMSLSVYAPRLNQWRQTWVDTDGNYWAFNGGSADGRMVLRTQDVIEGKEVHFRMVFYNISADEIDWNWERSDDDGQTWELRWHIHYRRK